MSVLSFSVQSLRASFSRARSRATESLTLPRRFEPRLARESLRWRRTSRRARPGLSPGTVSISPVDSAALTANAAVDPDDLASTGYAGIGLGDRSECDMPATRAVQRHPVGLRVIGNLCATSGTVPSRPSECELLLHGEKCGARSRCTRRRHRACRRRGIPHCGSLSGIRACAESH